jgi:hypothetical protein
MHLDLLPRIRTGARRNRRERKRLMGFEPTTFCMAIRPIFRDQRAANMAACSGFTAARQTTRDLQYAPMWADMQRIGNFGEEVP